MHAIRRFTAIATMTVFLAASQGAQAQKQTSPQPGLQSDPDFQQIMQPIPRTSIFAQDGYYVWCGTVVQGDDGRYHLYYSRWPLKTGFQSWVTSSEIAHAVGDSPTGPFIFHDVALPARGKQYWDGTVTHNPTIHRFHGKYFLYYMGNTGDGIITSNLNMMHRNNQRIGVATSDSPDGPWKRLDRPVIDVSANRNAPDSLCVANPSITEGPNGRFYLLYKAVGQKNPLPFGGPVVHLMATSTSPTGPFTKDLTPLFLLPGSAFPFEDPSVWFDAHRDRFYAILKDNHGALSDTGRSSLVLFASKDARHWQPSPHLLVSDLKLHWDDGKVEEVSRMERPQITLDKQGEPMLLTVAISKGDQSSYNVRIPLQH